MLSVAHCLVMQGLHYQATAVVGAASQILVGFFRRSPATQLQEPIVQDQLLTESFRLQREGSDCQISVDLGLEFDEQTGYHMGRRRRLVIQASLARQLGGSTQVEVACLGNRLGSGAQAGALKERRFVDGQTCWQISPESLWQDCLLYSLLHHFKLLERSLGKSVTRGLNERLRDKMRRIS